MKTMLSFVIPCYNSEKTISPVIEEITQVVADKESLYDYEIITINDSSKDQVLPVLTSLAAQDSHIKVIDFARNFGQQAALMAGLKFSHGDIVVFLDDDFQCPLKELWNLLAPLEEGFDVSYANYGYKKESLFRNLGSGFNDFLCCMLLSKPKDLQLSNFVAFKRFIADEMLLYSNPYPYIDGLVLRSTSHVANVPMEDRSRLEGSSNYSLRKLLSLFVNEFTSFSIKPLRFASVAGITCAFGGIVYMIVIILMKLFRSDIDAGYSSLMAVILFIGGMIMLLLGICGEYIGRIYISINRSPQYVIRGLYNLSQEKPKD